MNVRDWHSIYYQNQYVTEQKPPNCHFVTSREIYENQFQKFNVLCSAPPCGKTEHCSESS